MCSHLEVSESIQVGVDGRLKQIYVCDTCGSVMVDKSDRHYKQPSIKPPTYRYDNEGNEYAE